jgi:hypothetical protein
LNGALVVAFQWLWELAHLRQFGRARSEHCMPSEMLVFGGAHGGSETKF